MSDTETELAMVFETCPHCGKSLHEEDAVVLPFVPPGHKEAVTAVIDARTASDTRKHWSPSRDSETPPLRIYRPPGE
ncbi:hypothetical protein VT84_14220 [Gemmata sp. SH-PL17]|uniref:hypothetical protein n=1 Tax=Gemmata sp. SH-PL17 TaxID=1630693 RepID=UPI00078E70F2|nr:hypothetical protein [Gemmata sp. SH-PL17]AMV25549.1 hypothetical protein VT84_14220 [Gemmata sp. SH-PL17]